jgi:pimeloyl-ACP methyl ester carboxylesterase
VHRVRAGEVELSVREWPGEGRPFLLVHGLASNAKTWDGVARRLNEAGHRVVAVDQRGHGLSDKPDGGYGHASVAADLHALIGALGMERPIVAGQSWGAGVVLHLAAEHPESVSGLVLVDGGLYDMAQTGTTWEERKQRLTPPNLLGTPRPQMIERFRSFHPTWDDEQIEMQMGNYETLEDGTIRPWLTLERHMTILRAIWDEPPSAVHGRVAAPTLLAIADPSDAELKRMRLEASEAAARRLQQAEVRLFEGAPHDIHVDRPVELAEWMLEALDRGFFD